MARSLRLLAAVPLLGLMMTPALASGRYEVQPRETFYSIARKCQVDVYELMGLNPRPDDTLKLGEQLRLPSNAQCGTSSGDGAVLTNNSLYKVQPRESFYSIARKCQVSAGELMALNPRPGDTLKLGEQLRLPGNAQCGAHPGADSGAGATVVTKQFYRIQPGDGIFSIARSCQVKASQLMALNPKVGRNLQPDQQLQLPSNANCPPSSTVVVSTSQRTDTVAAVTPEPGQTKTYYEVQARESFYSIARKCQVKPKELMALNPRPGDALHAGEYLELPGGVQCAGMDQDQALASTQPETPARGQTATDPGWRDYGPFKVNWQDWQMIDGHWVAQTLGASGEPLYLAINCPAKRINRTGSNGQWSTWESPNQNFEERLMADLCQEKA